VTRLELKVIQGDITTVDTEVIVNAANNEFWMGAGVAGAIKAAGGDNIEKEAIEKGPVMPGRAIYTAAGKLKFNYIIHAAVMGQNLKTSRDLIQKSTVSALQLADKLNVKSITLPAFGTGVGGFPIKPCALIMTQTARSFESVAKSLKLVQFCLFDAVTYKLFKDALENLPQY
jgi:O-acetyl-ADP-ribose deacetylase (regulator of RNase III)